MSPFVMLFKPKSLNGHDLVHDKDGNDLSAYYIYLT
jgi:hypothetical protein